MMKNLFLSATISLALAATALGIPSVGDPLPDLTVFDENGTAFPLREKLKGKPAVIVFGCLT